jgi:hypothetical protein
MRKWRQRWSPLGTSGLARNASELEKPVLEEAEPEQQAPYLLIRAGMVNALVGRYQINNFAPPLPYGESGVVIRVVIAANRPPKDAQLDTTTKAKLREAIQRSSLERWLEETVNEEAASVDWIKASPNTGHCTTLNRPPVMSSAARRLSRRFAKPS